MKLLQYAAKLAKMSPSEISFRSRQVLRNRLEAGKVNPEEILSQPHLLEPEWIRSWDFSTAAFPSTSVKFFGLAEVHERLRGRYEKELPGQRSRLVAEAEKRCNQEFEFLGLPVKCDGTIPWNRNPQTGAEYPLMHHSQMDTFNTGKYGDVKFVWELNRHQFFIEIARAYLVTGDEKFPAKIWEWLESWIAATPFKIGINNTSVLEHAVRIYSWAWAYFFTQHSPLWTADRLRTLTRQLLLQGAMIEENLSFYYSPYNHLIGELAALSFLGTLMEGHPRMEKWRDKYWGIMEDQLERQFSPDGFTVEQASYYHHFTLGFYLMNALLRKQNNLPVAPKTWEYLERATEFAMHLTRPDRQLPMLGDIDSARSVYFYPPERQWDLTCFQALGAVLFGRRDMKFVSRTAAEELLWLLGTAGIEAFHALESKEPEGTSRVYRQSGYAVFRSNWDDSGDFILFDFGEIADGVHKDTTPSAAHGHADILSIEICRGGKPLVIDPGFHTYFGAEEWHRYFRDTRGHNTISVNECGQAVHEGRIGWSRVSSPLDRHWLHSEGLSIAGASLDRFASQDDVRHRREIVYRRDQYLLVLDHVFGNFAGKALTVESSLHFANTGYTLRDGGVYADEEAVLIPAIPPDFSLQYAEGGDGPDQGWMAEGYGKKRPAGVLRIKGETSEPLFLAMLFPLNSAGKLFELSAQKLEDDLCRIAISTEGRKEEIVWNPEGAMIAGAEHLDLQSDAPLWMNVGDQSLREVLLAFPTQIMLDGAGKDVPHGSATLAQITREQAKKPEILFLPCERGENFS